MRSAFCCRSGREHDRVHIDVHRGIIVLHANHRCWHTEFGELVLFFSLFDQVRLPKTAIIDVLVSFLNTEHHFRGKEIDHTCKLYEASPAIQHRLSISVEKIVGPGMLQPLGSEKPNRRGNPSVPFTKHLLKEKLKNTAAADLLSVACGRYSTYGLKHLRTPASNTACEQ